MTTKLYGGDKRLFTAAEDTPLHCFDQLKKLIQADEDYAWGWHCNLACPAMDEGIDHATANKIASRIMRHFFDIDMEKTKYWESLKVKS